VSDFNNVILTTRKSNEVEAYYGIGKITIHEKDAKFGENRKIFFFAGFAQPEADPSQPKADPSSGELWRSLGAESSYAKASEDLPKPWRRGKPC